MHGKDLQSGRKLKNWMIETGYVDVVEQQFFVPLNQWPLDPADKELGSWSSRNWLKFLGGTKKLLAAGGVPLEEIPMLLEEVRHDITNWNMRVYWISKLSLGILCSLAKILTGQNIVADRPQCMLYMGANPSRRPSRIIWRRQYQSSCA